MKELVEGPQETNQNESEEVEEIRSTPSPVPKKSKLDISEENKKVQKHKAIAKEIKDQVKKVLKFKCTEWILLYT